MKNFTGRLTAISTTLLLLFGCAFLTIAVDAQTKKRAKKPLRKTSVPQPLPTQTLPVVVSQADLYQNQTPVVIPENNETSTIVEPETVDQKMDKLGNRMREMNTRVKSLETSKQTEYDNKQKRLLMNLDILTRAETRAESLRKQLFDLIEKEGSIKEKLETIDYDIRPDTIDRQVAFAGSLRPEELREMKKKNLEAEKRNLENLLTEIGTTRTNLETNVQKADQLVEKLRSVLEKDIDDALTEQPKDQ